MVAIKDSLTKGPATVPAEVPAEASANSQFITASLPQPEQSLTAIQQELIRGA